MSRGKMSLKKYRIILRISIWFLILTGCSSDYEAPVRKDISGYSGSPYVVMNNNIPEFDETEILEESYEYYSPLDNMGRCGEVYACIGEDLMPTEERKGIGFIKPAGWHTVKYDFVDGKYLYNRCHLIGYQLSGENDTEENLITGTRYMNVQGMLPFENMVADYVKETGNHVMYRVTPVYEGQNLLADGVEIEAMSVEDDGEGILFHVFCYNIQPGVVIDYATGESWLDETAHQDDKSDTGDKVYVTKNGKKYHRSECQYLKENADEISLSDALNQGLEPCSKCNPPQ